MTSFHPSRIAPRVTPAHKRAVWSALAGRRLMLDDLAAVSGVDPSIVTEVWAQGSAAGRLAYEDDCPGWRGIVRVEGAA